MLDKLQLKAHEAIFVDDLAVNVQAAESLGMTGIELENQDGKAVVDKLEKILHLQLH